jgi:hypothetical protein
MKIRIVLISQVLTYLALIAFVCIMAVKLAQGSSVGGGAVLPTAVTTGHIDQTRQSWNDNERLLTPAIVQGGSFKKRASLTVSGFIFSQPLIVPGIVISGVQKDLLIVTTMNGNVYAFDANNYGAALWTAAIGNPMTSYPQSSHANAYYQQPLGCVSTPAADVPNNKLYVVCGDQTAPSWILHVLKLTDGTSVGTKTLTGSVSGSGDPTGPADNVSGGVLTFYPFYASQRAALLLANGSVYVPFTGEEDSHPWHGWVFAYNASTLAKVGVWCATPNNYGGGVWQSGGGPSVDAAGNIYVTTGNGLYDGSTNFADSVVKLRGSDLAQLDWFTSSDYANNQSADADISSGRPILISPNRLLIASKNFYAYVLDTGCMGHLQGSGSGCALQTWQTVNGTPGAGSGIYGGLFGLAAAYLNTATGTADSYAYSVSGGTFNTTPFITSAVSTPSATISSNAGTNGIVWVVTYSGSPYSNVLSGVLRALNPATFAEYWNSSTSGTDTLGTMAKWCSPVVANGHVYVPNNGSQVVVYAAF